MTRPSPERWRRIQEVFDAVVDLEPAARTLYLAAACINDPPLRDEVERLLAADQAAGNSEFLDDIVRDAALDLAQDITRTGHRVGPYRIVRELGRGGMGAVYLAERADDAYAGQVAIKFVRGATGDTDLQRRFRAERQILADLRHPGIPRLLDGGEAEDRTPFLVMEYIEGEPITQYVRRVGVPIRERLRLFLEVCDAVAHAHRSLIVHRDIKPGNVLVDREGRPRLVDFGIAKPLGPDFTAETTTVFRRLTPAHASPEQLRGERITVATDVYALGLLLYELVSGVQPFAAKDASGAEIQRKVLEEDAPPPSVAATREPDPARPAMPRGLARDIDAIALTAIRKEPERRYASAEQLAQDVRRALDGAPVLARGGDAGYRLLRTASRYRGPIIAAAAVLMVVGVLGTLSLTRLLDARADEREQVAANDRVALLLALGSAQVDLGALDEAEATLERAWQAAEEMDAADARTAETITALAPIYDALAGARRAAGDSARADAAARTAQQLRARTPAER